MATYTQLSKGMKGDDVKRMQTALVKAGYDIGSSGVDGSFGRDTEAAVIQYQKDNGLKVDGYAGNETLGHLYGASGSSATKKTSATQKTSGTKTDAALPDASRYDVSGDEGYRKATAALEAAEKKAPTYAATYDQAERDAFQKIMNRDPFSYDINQDALYEQYKDKYVMLGETAAQDVMGQAAAMTGGYGSSYATTAASQAYQSYLQQLNDVVPELYGMARDQYDQETQNLYDQYDLIAGARDNEFSRYLSELDIHNENIKALKGKVDDAYDLWLDKLNLEIDSEDKAYTRKLDAYKNLVSLIAGSGYTPTSAELKAAGMTSEQAKSLKTSYENSLVTGADPLVGDGAVEEEDVGGGPEYPEPTYEDAYDHAIAEGVPEDIASSKLMRPRDWAREKKHGSTYEDYIDWFVKEYQKKDSGSGGTTSTTQSSGTTRSGAVVR